jgi:peptide deformylase
MAVLKVARLGHPVLRQRATAIPPERLADPRLQRLIDDMVETMEDYQGIGLAAPQVFQSLRLIVLGALQPEDEDSIPLTVLVNPELMEMSGEKTQGWEGCLSIPDLRGVVPRSASVSVRGLSRRGEPLELEVRDYFARVLQHEIDHLDGVLFLDRMKDFQTLTHLEEYRRYWLEPEE